VEVSPLLIGNRVHIGIPLRRDREEAHQEVTVLQEVADCVVLTCH